MNLPMLRRWFADRLPLEELEAVIDHKTVPQHRHSIWYYLGGMTLFFFLVQVVTGRGASLGSPLISQVDYMMFTGSTATGRVVAAESAENQRERGSVERRHFLTLDRFVQECARDRDDIPGVGIGELAGPGQLFEVHREDDRRRLKCQVRGAQIGA